MVKYSAEIKDGKLLGIGLTNMNIEKLKKGMPILVKLPDLKILTGWNGSIVIMYGKTKKAIKREIKQASLGKIKYIDRIGEILKFSFTIRGEKTLGIGINESHTNKLIEWIPFKIEYQDLKDLTGWEGKILLSCGDSEEDIREELSDYIGENTKIIDKKKEYIEKHLKGKENGD